jgi:hypothetical protein
LIGPIAKAALTQVIIQFILAVVGSDNLKKDGKMKLKLRR